MRPSESVKGYHENENEVRYSENETCDLIQLNALVALVR